MRLHCLHDRPREGAMNMALDEVLLDSVRAGRRAAALRFYGWDPPCLSLGYFQKGLEEIDRDQVRSRGFHLVRRLTGGRAVLHDREITYSLAMAASPGVLESFKAVNEALLSGLERLGVRAALVPRGGRGGGAPRSPVCFLAPSWYEISFQGRKLLGSAQVRRGPWMLQHGSLPLTLDRSALLSLFRGGSAYSREALEKMTSLGEAAGRDFPAGEVIAALREGFRTVFSAQVVEDAWTHGELLEAEALAGEKYSLRDW